MFPFVVLGWKCKPNLHISKIFIQFYLLNQCFCKFTCSLLSSFLRLFRKVQISNSKWRCLVRYLQRKLNWFFITSLMFDTSSFLHLNRNLLMSNSFTNRYISLWNFFWYVIVNIDFSENILIMTFLFIFFWSFIKRIEIYI